MDWELDEIDVDILGVLQENCKRPLAKIGEEVGLSAPSVQERVKKIEDHGVILGYRAIVDAHLVGKDVTAFIGVSIDHPRRIESFEKAVAGIDDILECHHVTGNHTLLVKIKTESTTALHELISRIRSLDGVARTETMVVLATAAERTRIPVRLPASSGPRRPRRSGDRPTGVHAPKEGES